ncbi:hypothetical protein B0H14DRAFT_3462898 [Mycena olivaceomarginata]|nr:hypothetical protein B0H14DRAFT_3462898 [Mycena olivaceomarginata]
MARAAFRLDLACRKSGKVAKGENFWGQADEWFKKVAERGWIQSGEVMSTSVSSTTEANSKA